MTKSADIDYLDHTITITRRYEQVWRRYEDLGFTLSPLSRHLAAERPGGPLIPSCTGNRCALFGETFIELIGIVDESAPDPWRVLPLIGDGFSGLRGYSFGCGDSAVAGRRLAAAGLSSSGVLALQRDVETPDGIRTARFRSAHLDRERTPEGILHTAEQLTPELIHQDRYLTHANGARGVHSVLLVVADDEFDDYLRRYALMLDRTADVNGPRRVFALRAGRIELVPASAFDTVLPGEELPRLPFIAAQTVAVDDLALARKLVEGNGIPTRTGPDGFFVGADDAFGSAVGFTAVR
ncbi:VOC family protein [Amycolatopsis anabasis]|uniref:VOC family protein n=1 Tax=Amycolatopsis anabasis TaxID=1840409 RepID=UPI00131A94C4|nr:VOC family protein [Amycolatopsis anabasis]